MTENLDKTWLVRVPVVGFVDVMVPAPTREAAFKEAAAVVVRQPELLTELGQLGPVSYYRCTGRYEAAVPEPTRIEVLPDPEPVPRGG